MSDLSVEMIRTSVKQVGEQDKYADLFNSTLNLQLIQGSVDEDSPVLNVRNHFYNPLFPLGRNGLNLIFDSALSKASELWGSALVSHSLFYANGYQASQVDAYHFLGRILHLAVQDMAQPAHTQNDPHVPISLVAGDSSPLEDRAADMSSSFPGDVPDVVLGSNLRSIEDYARTVATISHRRSSLSGLLSFFDLNGYVLLPDGKRLDAVLEARFNTAHLMLEPVWILRADKDLNYWPSITGDGLGAITGEALAQDWWPVLFGDGYYIDRQDDIRLQDGRTLSEYFINTLGPLGIQYGAGLIKFFHDVVNSPPYVKDIRISGAGAAYSRYVSPGNTSSFTRSISPEQSVQFKYGETYNVEVAFSEPVDSVSFAIGNAQVLGPPGNKSDDAGRWSGTFTFQKEANQTPSCDSDISLTISAKDRHNHFGGQGSDLDLDPTTVARRETSAPYSWIGYETSADPLSTFKAPCDCDDEEDETPPTVSLNTKPGCQNGNVELTGSAHDNCELESVTVDGQPVTLGRGGSFSLTRNFSEGEHTVTAVARDKSGKEAAASIQIKIDSTAPQPTTKTPEGGPIPLSAPVSITFDEDITEGQISVSGVSGTSVRSGRTLTFQHEPFVGEQTYTVTVSGVKDQCGNAAAGVSWTFFTAPFDADMDQPPEDPEMDDFLTGDLEVGGYINNPNGPATITVCMIIDGVRECRTQVIPPGLNNRWNENFGPRPGFEGVVCFETTFEYLGKSFKRERCRVYDLRAPELGTNPLDNVTVGDDFIDINAAATDGGSGVRTLTFGSFSASISKPQGAVAVQGTHKGLQFGANDIKAVAIDAAGNKTEKTIVVNRSGSAAWALEGSEVGCGELGRWVSTIQGIPGLDVELTFTKKGKTNKSTGKIGGDQKFSATHTGEGPGDYKFSAKTTVPTTGEVVLNKTAETYIHACKYDPTFISDAGIFETPNDIVDNRVYFSPGLIPFVEGYAAVYAQTVVNVSAYNSSGERTVLINNEVRPAGFYSLVWNGLTPALAPYPNGPYTVTIDEENAVDSTQRRTDSIDVFIDGTSPTAVLSHLEGTPVNPKAFRVMGTVTDNAKLKEYTVFRTQGPNVTALLAVTSGSPEPLATIDATAWPAGGYSIHVEAKDAAGNKANSNTLSLTISDTSRTAPYLFAEIDGQEAQNLGGVTQPPDDVTVFIEDDIPSGATPIGDWNWAGLAYSGARAHTSSDERHYFIHSNPGLALTANDNIIQYVYVDDSVEQILLQFYTDQGNGEHRVYWGDSHIQTGGTEGTASLIRAGPLPPANTWARLRIPSALVGLDGKTVKGVLYGVSGGVAHWDKTTTSKSTRDLSGLGYTLPPIITSDDTTATRLSYTLNTPSPIKIDVVNAAGVVVKNVLNAAMENEGFHNVVWDQTTNAGADAPDGNYAFVITNPAGVFDTDVFSRDPQFSGSGHPSLTTTPAIDTNGNRYEIHGSSIVKKNPDGLVLAVVAFATQSISGVALDGAGHLYFQTTGGVERWQAGRVPFSVKSLQALVRVPWPNAMVKATVPIIGAATGRNFKDYTVDVKQGWPSSLSPEAFSEGGWTTLAHSAYEVQDNFEFPLGQETVYGNLASWETGLTPGEEYPEQDIFHPAGGDAYRGRWMVRLRVNNFDGETAVSTVPVIVGRVVNNATGGLIRSDDDKVRVIVPPLALSQDWSVFSILSHSTQAADGLPVAPAGLQFAGALYEMMPPGSEFRRPVRMEIDSDDGLASLYWYNRSANRWEFASNVTAIISSKTVVVDPNLQKLPAGRAFFALLAPIDRPEAPLLYQVESPTNDPFIVFRGQGRSAARLALFSLDISTAFEPVETVADQNGRFQFPLVYLKAGTHNLAAVQTFAGESISSGLLSDPSNTVSVIVSTPPALTVSSLKFFNAGFLSVKAANFKPNETARLELIASDPNPSLIDNAYVLLRSTVTDPAGIVLKLTETGAATGRYRGGALISSVTAQGFFQLGAVHEGELIEAVSLDNPSIKTALYLENNDAPPAPEIFSLSHPSAFQHTFETGVDSWQTYDLVAGADVSLSTHAATGLNSIRLTQNKPDGNFSSLIFDRPVSIRQTPILSFDMRMDQPVRFNLFFRHKNTWLEYILNDAGELSKNFPPAFQTLGSHVPDQKSAALAHDGVWEHVEINLFNHFRQRFPQAASDADFTIDSIILGDWNARELFGMTSGNTPIGSWVEFDNVILTNAGRQNQHPEFTWTGEGSYSVVVDQSSNTVPNSFVNTQVNAHRALNLPSGFYYAHVRARNSNENWGPPNHYRILVDREPPQILNPSPAPLSRSENLNVSVTVFDPIGHGVDPDSIRFSVNGVAYDKSSQAIAYDAATGQLSIALGRIKPAAPLITDGQFVTFAIEDAADWAGNRIVQPFSWNWQADFSRFAGGDFAPLTINGGREPAWSPDGAQIVFQSNRLGQSDLWVMSSTDSAESAGSVRTLTSDVAEESGPAWSPDGRWIAYATNKMGSFDLWLVDALTGESKALTQGADDDVNPSWSQNGQALLFTRKTSGLGTIRRLGIDPATGNALSNTQVSLDDIGFNLEPRYVNNDTQIVYRRSLYIDNLYIMNADGTNPRPLTATGKDTRPAAKNGTNVVAFATTREADAFANDVSAIWTTDTSGDNARRLLNNENRWPDTEPAWSPDGSRLAFATTRSGSWNVWTLSLLDVSALTVSSAAFSSSTQLRFSISANATVSLDIFNTEGTLVCVVASAESKNAGVHTYNWDGRNNAGALLPEGLYKGRLTVIGAGTPEPILKETTVRIDRAAPVTVLKPDLFAPPYVSTAALLTLESQDGPNASGVNTVFYSVDGEAVRIYTGEFSLAAGTHTVLFYAVDNAGNNEEIKTIVLAADDKAPFVTTSLVGPQIITPQGPVISANTAIRLSAVDIATTVISGVRGISYQMDANAIFSGTQAVVNVVANDLSGGTHTLTFSAADRAGNSSPAANLSFAVDATPPSVSFSFVPASVFNGVRDYALRGATVSFIATDENGVASVTPPIILNVNGPRTLFYKAVDRLGNESPVQTHTVVVSDQLPLSRLRIEGAHLPPYVSTATRFFVEAMGPVARLEASVDGGAFVTVSSGSATVFPVEGPHSLAFRAVRPNLTFETADSLSVITDARAPVSFFSANEVVAVNPDTLIVFSSSDVLPHASGMATTYFSLNGSTSIYGAPFTLRSKGLITGATVPLALWSVDRVGNAELPLRHRLVLDVTKPASQLITAGPRYDASGFVYGSSRTVFEVNATDTGSPASGIKDIFVSTGAPAFVYTSPLVFERQGAFDLRTRAVDRANNHESTQTYRVVIDTTPPFANVEVLGEGSVDGSNITLRENSFLVVIAPDDLSGLLSVQRSLNGGAFVESNEPFSLPAAGAHVLRVRAIDRVQNEIIRTYTVGTDDEPPATTVHFSTPSVVVGTTAYISTSTIISLAATDNSGVQATFYNYNDELTLRTYVSTFTAPVGLHRLNYFSTDFLGNVEATKHVALVVSTQPVKTGDITPPGPVTNLHAVSVSSRQATLKWNMPGDDGFSGDTYGRMRIYLATIPAVIQMNLMTEWGTVVSTKVPGQFQLYNLLPSTTYYARVQIGDEVPNYNSPSNMAVFKTSPSIVLDTTPPATVADLRVQVFSSTQVHLSWSMPGDDGLTGDTYGRVFVYLSTFPTPTTTHMRLLSASGTVVSTKAAGQFQMFDYLPATLYYTRILVADEVPNMGGPSNVATFITWSASLADASPLQFTQELYSVNESSAAAVVVVNRPSGAGPIWVDYTTVDNTALAGTDYVESTGTLKWNAGDWLSKTITIPLINGAANEPTEIFHVVLGNIQGRGFYPGTNAVRIAITDAQSPNQTMVVSAGDDQTIIDTRGDGHVDGSDFLAWQRMYGTEHGDLNWNACFDSSADGAINGLDLLIITAAFGSSPSSSRWDARADINDCGIERVRLDGSKSVVVGPRPIQYTWRENGLIHKSGVVIRPSDLITDVTVKGYEMHYLTLDLKNGSGTTTSDLTTVTLKPWEPVVTDPDHDQEPDGQVDFLDLNVLKKAFSHIPDDAEWNGCVNYVRSADEIVDMRDVHAFLPHWASKTGDQLYDRVFDINFLDSHDIGECGNTPPYKVKPNGPAPKFQPTSPVRVEIIAGPVRSLDGYANGLKTVSVKADSHSFTTKNRQYLWFVKECVESKCAPVSIHRLWSKSTEINFTGNPTIGVLAVEGRDWNVAYHNFGGVHPVPTPTPTPRPSRPGGLRLSRPVAINYLFSPTRGAKGSIKFSIHPGSEVKVVMYDRRGRELAVLLNAALAAGKYTVEWNGRDKSGAIVAPGAYSGRISAGGQAHWFKLIVTR